MRGKVFEWAEVFEYHLGDFETGYDPVGFSDEVGFCLPRFRKNDLRSKVSRAEVFGKGHIYERFEPVFGFEIFDHKRGMCVRSVSFETRVWYASPRGRISGKSVL